MEVVEKDFCHRISKDLHIIASLLHNVPTHKGVFNFDAILGITSWFWHGTFLGIVQNDFEEAGSFSRNSETESIHTVGDETYLKGQKVEDIKISFVWLQLNFHSQKVVIKRI